MSASGTYAFNPSVGELVLNAYARCGIRATALTAEHMVDARMESNLLLSEFSILTPNLWTIDLVTVDLVEGQTTYDVDPYTMMILDAYIRTGDDPPTDRIIMPISRTEYASYPNKEEQGYPTVFWFDRLLSPTITLWQVPDDNGPYTLRYYRAKQIQDADYTGAQTLDLPLRFLDAFAAGLAKRLARIHAPALYEARRQDAKEAWDLAAKQDTEMVPLYISPGLSGYYR